MPRRTILTSRQRKQLLGLPTDRAMLEFHYTLDEDDLARIKQRRRAHNKMGFALQLCAFRYPGRLLQPGEIIPHEVLSFIGQQIGISGDALINYAVRQETRIEHLADLRGAYGYRNFVGKRARALKDKRKAGIVGDANHNEANGGKEA